MAFTLRDGQGSLAKNTRKTKPGQPDIRGKVMLGGVLKQIAGWQKMSDDGSTWYSIQISDMQERGTNQSANEGNADSAF